MISHFFTAPFSFGGLYETEITALYFDSRPVCGLFR